VKRRLRVDDSGFTLPELLMTVIVMGMISYSIAMVLMHSITLVPQAGSRTGASASRAFLVDDFSDDVANSIAAVGADIFACADWPALGVPVPNETNVLRLSTYSGAVTYRARLVNPGGYTPDLRDLTTDVISVTVERVGPDGSVQVVAEGYCTFDGAKPMTVQVDGTSGGVRHRKVTMTLRLRDAPDMPPSPVTLVASMRKTD